MNPAVFPFTVANLRDMCEPVAAASRIVQGIMGSTNIMASLNPAMTWAQWDQRLTGSLDESAYSLDERLNDWLALWPDEDPDSLWQLRANCANERLFCQGVARRPRELVGFHGSKPGLQAATRQLSLVVNPMLWEWNWLLGWLGKWIAYLRRSATP